MLKLLEDDLPKMGCLYALFRSIDSLGSTEYHITYVQQKKIPKTSPQQDLLLAIQVYIQKE
jgi:hypothetical protein